MNETTRQRLRSAFREAHEHPRSDFYRALYAASRARIGADFPRTEEEWRALPLLTKEALVAAPFSERLFVPFSESGSIRVSSGTSGRGIVLIPRNFHVNREYYIGKFTKMLCFYFPHFGMEEACEPLGLGHIGADPTNMPATARMAKLFGIDALSGAVSPLLAFAPHLAEAIDARAIRYIHLFGERPSSAQFADLDRFFPAAELTWEYSNIETGGQSGRSCPHLQESRDDRVLTVDDRYYWELIDPETGEIIEEKGREGEIVLTTLWSGNSLPAIRYRTGDLAIEREKTCDCGYGERVFQILGRVAYDRAIIPGGELKSQELERVMEPLRGIVRDTFELHAFEERGAPLRLVLYVEPRRDGEDLARIAHVVARSMRITPERTIETSVREGLIAPLACALLQKDRAKKTTRIVKHQA